MSKPEIKHSTDLALFLPFSRIERRQRVTSPCNAWRAFIEQAVLAGKLGVGTEPRHGVQRSV